jgi:hypothetical protein
MSVVNMRKKLHDQLWLLWLPQPTPTNGMCYWKASMKQNGKEHKWERYGGLTRPWRNRGAAKLCHGTTKLCRGTAKLRRDACPPKIAPNLGGSWENLKKQVRSCPHVFHVVLVLLHWLPDVPNAQVKQWWKEMCQTNKTPTMAVTSIGDVKYIFCWKGVAKFRLWTPEIYIYINTYIYIIWFTNFTNGLLIVY